MDKLKIDLPNRYGDKNYLERTGEDIYALVLGNAIPCRYIMDPASKMLVAFDPAGGPFVEVDSTDLFKDHKVAAIWLSNDRTYLKFLSDDENYENEKALIVKSLSGEGTTTCGSVQTIELEAEMERVMPERKTVIGMIGKAGSGKDTAADYIVARYGFEKLAFADPLKKVVQTAFNIDDGHMYDREMREMELPEWPGWSVRKLLQFVATEMFRNMIDQEIWVKNAASRVREIHSAVISDTRFPNEVEGLKKMLEGDDRNIVYVKIERPGHEGAKSGIKNHASESQIDDLPHDYVIINDGSLDDLYSKVDELMADII